MSPANGGEGGVVGREGGGLGFLRVVFGGRWLEGRCLPGLGLYRHELWYFEDVHLQTVSITSQMQHAVRSYLSITGFWDWLPGDLHVHGEHFLLLKLDSVLLGHTVCSAFIVARVEFCII